MVNGDVSLLGLENGIGIGQGTQDALCTALNAAQLPWSLESSSM